MQDGIGRRIEYLRISVTDRCNLRCRYCMPPEGVKQVPHAQVLTLEEIYRITAILVRQGVRKVRLTGGEPLVRRNLCGLIDQLHRLPGLSEIAMTTNGLLFLEQAESLQAAGLTSVNFSLDTLDADRYDLITGSCYEEAQGAGEGRRIERVLRGIDKALDLGMHTKVNCVPCKEWNGQDIESVASLAKERPVDVRYIELMPIGLGREYTGISSEEILRRLEAVYGEASRADSSGQGGIGGPATYYTFKGFQGRIGLISPLSHKFCSECNRVRLTCEGRLKLCLHYDTGLDCKPLLRTGASDEELTQSIREAMLGKPIEHHFTGGEDAEGAVESRRMVQIGG